MTEASKPQNKSLIHHVLTMPHWQKTLLTLAAITLGAGLAGQGAGMFKARPQAVEKSSGSAAPSNSRGVVSDEKHAEESAAAPEKAWYEKLSPHATRIGLTFIVGFLLGWAFRVFLKTMAMITALACAIFFGLSYFNVMNIDFSKAEKKYESSKTWLVDQAAKLKDSVASHLPSSSATVVGMFVGFRRKS